MKIRMMGLLVVEGEEQDVMKHLQQVYCAPTLKHTGANGVTVYEHERYEDIQYRMKNDPTVSKIEVFGPDTVR